LIGELQVINMVKVHTRLINNLIYKSKRGVSLSVFDDKQGRGRAGRLGQTPAHSRSFSVTPRKVTIVVVSVCVWAMLVGFFHSVPVPCGASLDVTDSREKEN